MKHLKTYQLFEARTELTKEQEAFLDRYTEGTWTYNPATGLVDVKGDFDCSYEKLKDLKGVRFGKVNGRFYCRNNELTSLKEHHKRWVGISTVGTTNSQALQEDHRRWVWISDVSTTNLQV